MVAAFVLYTLEPSKPSEPSNFVNTTDQLTVKHGHLTFGPADCVSGVFAVHASSALALAAKLVFCYGCAVRC